MPTYRPVSVALWTAILLSSQAPLGRLLAQPHGGIPPQTTLGHELFLVVVGAVLGGFLGPICQAVDNWLGWTPGARSVKANYEVQREIAASLRELVEASRDSPEGRPGSPESSSGL